MNKTILTSIIIVLIAVIGVVTFTNGNTEQVDNNVSNIDQNTDSSDNTNENSNTFTNLQTCINKEFGYTVSYPANWNVYEYPKDPKSPGQFIEKQTCEKAYTIFSKNNEDIGIENPGIAIEVRTDEQLDNTVYADVTTLEEYFEVINANSEREHYNFDKLEKVTIDGEIFVRINGNELVGFHNGSRFRLFTGNSENTTTTQRVVSTFTFTN